MNPSAPWTKDRARGWLVASHLLRARDQSGHPARVPVSGLVDIALDDAITLVDGDTKNAKTVPARYATRTATGREYSEASLITADLVPNYLKLDQLYLRLFIAASRFCAGESKHLF